MILAFVCVWKLMRNIQHTSNEKNLQKSAILFGTKSNAYLQINRPIFGYFWLFLPICESVANLHESTLLFAPNIHAYFAYFSSFDLCTRRNLNLLESSNSKPSNAKKFLSENWKHLNHMI